jgi:cytidylate kinase
VAAMDDHEGRVAAGVQVAIDGPAGAGKSTVARLTAQALGALYIDSGAMYRAVALMCEQRGVHPHDTAATAAIAESIEIRFTRTDESLEQRVFVNDTDVTDALRAEAISRTVPAVAAQERVRAALVERQRALAATDGAVVMDGRDIGTCVLPAAQVKIFLTAPVEVRAYRRYMELVARRARSPVAATGQPDEGERGVSVPQPASLEEVQRDLVARDELDSGRGVSPLRRAADAVLLDTSNLTPNEAARMIATLAALRRGS